ncbi:MAG: translation initiation factor IF-2 [bacterium]|nr:translation initiation factor IF-2 [bacterium]
MKKVRVHEIAKKLGMSSKELVAEVQDLGVEIKSYMSTVDEDTAKLILEMLTPVKGDIAGKMSKKPEYQNKTGGQDKGKTPSDLEAKKDKLQPKEPAAGEEEGLREETIEPAAPKKIQLTEAVTVKELADKMGKKPNEVIKKLIQLGVMASINQILDVSIAVSVVESFGFQVSMVSLEGKEELDIGENDPSQLVPRPPVVTVMGHVDHGKTKLLDAIRKTNVASSEHGGITQHIGAYKVRLPGGDVTFLDTPGHEAFTAMRARGAQVTDVVILVVAADDGVMPQTIEAINHARAAGVPIVVAINKIDKPEANPERVKNDLAKLDLIPEEWGGKTIFVEVSAKTGQGIDRLLEMMLLEAEMLELKANPNRPATGTIIEAKLHKGRGPVATVLVQNGTLRVGDPFVTGLYYGKVRALINDKGENVKEATPSTPVEILGISGVPQVGDSFIVVSDERKARLISTIRLEKQRTEGLRKTAKVTLEDLYERIKKGEVKELKVILKADVQGSVQAISDSLERLSTSEVGLKVIHGSVGAITETDVMLASSSNAIILGFNVRPEPKAAALAEKEKVDIRSYTIIYDLLKDVQSAMKGMLEPTYREVTLGRAEVRQVFNIPKVGAIGGAYVLEGKIIKGSKLRLLRDNIVIYEGKISSLRRFKDDAREVQSGYECGIGLENYNDLKPGDIIEDYELQEVEVKL